MEEEEEEEEFTYVVDCNRLFYSSNNQEDIDLTYCESDRLNIPKVLRFD